MANNGNKNLAKKVVRIIGKLIFMANKFNLIGTLCERGYWEDFLQIDRVMIENNRCPHCGLTLLYKGLSNAAEYRAFGVCPACEFAREFWTEKAEIASVKKRFSGVNK